MRGIEQRLERIKELLGATECICGDADVLEIVVVEEGWDEARIRAAEGAKAITCPVHGMQMPRILRLSGSDVDA